MDATSAGSQTQDLEDSLLMLQAARIIEIDGLTKANSEWRIKIGDE
ncbi:hypothetical protein Q1M63_00540 (plasmid) [Sinorhizobium meliloti]|nr:hypothetical protein Q1M63_00540 [Sinorhizobium meliloti]